MKKKDNMTDLVENLPKVGQNTEATEGQVVNEQGEIITLGQQFARKVMKNLKEARDKEQG